ncbi:uncharacterized protein BKCO1_7900023 [Diplodia corticola]|uniref:Uncharacterized protein n=1 Tax=Diplodia corticola TaxID=236234 RepID=A0A1J9QN70_9PEZI|nr:uncharacterized protein BKCO1_7900023 [Diplodia corticola]OJD29514.1 hypothetical protein BKCO1_7900023 [Diplodia corticola]
MTSPTINKEDFVSPIHNLKRVQSLQSREPSIVVDRPLQRKDGYLGRWTLPRVLSVAFGILQLINAVHTLQLVFTIAAMHGKPEDDAKYYSTKTKLREISLWVTVTPILFTTIMGRFFSKFALYRAQTGITIGTLERFVGCQSIYTAIRTQVTMRPFTITSLGMILLWLLPPFASQAVLHLGEFSDTYNTTEGTVKYLPLIQAAQDTVKASEDVSMPLSRLLLSSAVFFQISLLMQSKVSSPRDFKDYVKIPSVHSLMPGNGSWNPAEWRQLDASRPTTYSSLMGIPIAGLSQDLNTETTFQLPSRHWAVNCSHIDSSMLDQNDFNHDYAWTHQAFVMDLAVPNNMTASQSSWPMRLVSMKGNPQWDAFADQVSDAQSEPAPLPKVPVNLAYCSIGAQNVVSNVSCSQTSCEVNSMLLLNEVQSADTSVPYLSSINVEDQSWGCNSRSCNGPLNQWKDVWNPGLWDSDSQDGLSEGDPNHDLATGGTPVQGLRMVLQTLSRASVSQEERFTYLESKNIPAAYARYTDGIGATNAELWLNGTNDGYVSSQYYPWPDYSSVPIADFSARLETLINTWWQSFYMPPYLQADLLHDRPAPPAFDAANRLVFKQGDTSSTPFNDTAARVTRPGRRVYRCRWPHMFVAMITSVVMVVAGGVTVVLEFVVVAPDVFGFASTYTRDNVHLPGHAEGSYKSGVQRASAMRDVRVRIGDVSAREVVGHISLTTDLGPTTVLRKDRQYD